MSMAMDPKVRHSLAVGDWVGAMAHGSYHTPFIGNGRNAWDAWKMGKPWSAAGHAGLFGVEALGMRSAGKVRGIVRRGSVAKGAAKATKAGKVSKQGKVVEKGVEAVRVAESAERKAAGSAGKASKVVRVAEVSKVLEKGRKAWTITNPSKTVLHGRFKKMYKDPKTNRWWSKDLAGHGDSAWKVFKEEADGLHWIRDADGFGDFLSKHKSSTGIFIPWKELNGR